MSWTRFGFQLALLFAVSLGSSAATWYALTRPAETISWKKVLNLTPEQEKNFSDMESEFNLTLKQISVEDAQNKISLCSYLHSEKMDPKDTDAMTRRMAGLYEQKQKTLAATLSKIAGMLTVEQRKLFAAKLMHEVCVSCRKSTETSQCLCGMCEHNT